MSTNDTGLVAVLAILLMVLLIGVVIGWLTAGLF